MKTRIKIFIFKFTTITYFFCTFALENRISPLKNEGQN